MSRRFLAGLFCAAFATGAVAGDSPEARFVSIGTGAQTGVYYVAGQAICRFLNTDTAAHGLHCKAPSSGGGVANVNGLRSGEFDFAIVQSDHQYKALNGLPPFEGAGAMHDVRALFSLHNEVLAILVRRETGIQGFDDLRGKRVSIGSAGSGQRSAFEDILQAKGWDLSAFGLVAELKPAEQILALGDGSIDAMGYFVGHPNGAIKEATLANDVVLVALDGTLVDALLATKVYYTRAEIPGGLYRGTPDATASLGTRAVFATSANADAEMVYQLVKAVFDNLERLRRMHPTFAALKEDEMVRAGLSAPLHEGALRYYRERGWL